MSNTFIELTDNFMGHNNAKNAKHFDTYYCTAKRIITERYSLLTLGECLSVSVTQGSV